MVATLLSILGWLLVAAATAGALYMVLAAATLRRFFAAARPVPKRSDGVTLLKPLYGAEPRLAANLASFLRQSHSGPVQLLCGVGRADDPAIAAVEDLRARFPQARIDLVVDETRHGANAKIGNLLNMAPHIAHDVVVLSDSDMGVGRLYLDRLLAALDVPGTGGVTCLYRGRGDAGFWSRLGAAGLSWQFLPGATFGVARGLATPSMGSTIALRRETLEAIGGFHAFADVLADDYAIGAAVRGLGLRMDVPPMLVTHASCEASFGALWRHELRWGVTVRGVSPGAYAASVISMPFPLALLAACFHPLAGFGVALAALVARWRVASTVDRITQAFTAPLWLIPLRDCLTFAVFVASFFARRVDWRGATLRMEGEGRIAAAPEIPVP